jgi:hypothetical protein
MPRKSTKDASASASAPRSSSKRPAQDTPSRQSKRARATARKSYAEPATDDEDASFKKASLETDDDVASGFEDHEDDASSESAHDDATSDEDNDDDDDEDEDVKPKKGASGGQSAKKGASLQRRHADEKELWKPGAKLAPGTQLIIKKPKAREAGDTPYTDETIHPNTMLFLKDLAANNDRSWLKSTSIPRTVLGLH